ncbi:MAG: endonuclease III [Planctomycetota bacterium]|nr:endonuclease III [Planctomycetota bacterium]MDA1142113.1 endonuclease III [Planctomycetota bacterium]
MARKTGKKKTAGKVAPKKSDPKKTGTLSTKTTSLAGRISADELQQRKKLAKSATKAIHELYPDADCELTHTNAHELLFATIMSAQSTDVNVNKVTEYLFQKYRTPADYANADPAEFEQDIKSTGFFRQKTKSVMGSAKKIVEDYGGEVPDDLDELVKLPGVARKTANVVLGTFFKKPTGVVVDTHVKRLANRIGLTTESDPEKIEKDLMELLPKDEWIFMGHAIIWHGRRVCNAKKPNCSGCTLNKFCPRVGVTVSA